MVTGTKGERQVKELVMNLLTVQLHTNELNMKRSNKRMNPSYHQVTITTLLREQAWLSGYVVYHIANDIINLSGTFEKYT